MNDLAIRPPRLTALGLRWTEDFRRGVLGVERNQGRFNGTAPDVVSLEGKWAKFPGHLQAYIEYPRTNYTTAITVNIWIQNIINTGVSVSVISQATDWNAVDLWTKVEWMLKVDIDATHLQALMYISGALKTCNYLAFVPSAIPQMVTLTWESGDYLRLLVNGVQVAQANLSVGIINNANQPLRIGNSPFSAPLEAEVSEPFVDSRKWSADELKALFDRSIFH